MNVNFGGVGLASVYSYIVAGGAVTCNKLATLPGNDRINGYDACRMMWGSNDWHRKTDGSKPREIFHSLYMDNGSRKTKVV